MKFLREHLEKSGCNIEFKSIDLFVGVASILGQRIEVDLTEEIENEGGIWVLEQKIDQPMDEEAGRLKNMYGEKVTLCHFLFLNAFAFWGLISLS